MNARSDIYDEAVFSPRSHVRARRRNQEITIRCLLEEAFEGAFLGREFWSEVKRETEEALPRWGASWHPI
jgi:hypothetical protein